MPRVSKHGAFERSVHFLMLITTGTANDYILSKVLEEEGETKLAPLYFIGAYLFFMVSNLIAPLAKFSEKWMMASASLAYAFGYFTEFLLFGSSQTMKYVLICVGASLGGWFSGFLWLGMGRYIHKACHAFDKVDEKGHYYGTFNSIYFLNNIAGGIVVTFGLQLFSHQNYFLLLTGIAVLAFLFGAVAIRNINYEE